MPQGQGNVKRPVAVGESDIFQRDAEQGLPVLRRIRKEAGGAQDIPISQMARDVVKTVHS